MDGCGPTTGAGATGSDDGVVHDESGDGEAGGAGFGVAVVAFAAADDAVSVPVQVVGEAAVGDRVRAVPRRIYVEEGVPRYGLKALPVDD